MFQLFKRKPNRSRIALEKIYPRIKNEVFASGPAATTGPIEHLVGDLYVIYAFEHANLFEILTTEAVEELGLSMAELHELAMNNFKSKIPDVTLQKYGDFYDLQTGQNFEACMILDNKFWQEEASRFSDSLIAGVPHRDHLMFCDGSNEDALNGLAEYTERDYREAQDNHGLSANLFEWTSDGWSTFVHQS
ncbi:MAG: DUF1444 family protein [Pseudomonadota bacterium]